MKKVRKAVLPVAGLGTRVMPGAKTTPKNLLNVFDRPILAYVVAEARAAGIEHIVVVLGRGQGSIEDYFDRHVELESHLEAKGKTDILADIRAELPVPGVAHAGHDVAALVKVGINGPEMDDNIRVGRGQFLDAFGSGKQTQVLDFLDAPRLESSHGDAG